MKRDVDRTSEWGSHYVVRIHPSATPTIEVTAEGYFSKTWLTEEGKQAWWITWDEMPSITEIIPEKNMANGLLVVADDSGRVEISADRFGTMPAFYRRDKDGLLVSNVFDITARDVSNEPDEIGFWELVLFETPFTDRTLLKQVRYLSAGTTLIFMPDREIQARRYWNYTFDTLDVKTVQQCAELCGEAMANGLKRYASVASILPIGGGVDCRLLAAALHKVSPKVPVTGVTYGYDPRILEYVYAKKIFQRFGWQKPHFHKLTPDSYSQCLDPLTRRTGALIGMQNCHFFDYLRLQGPCDTPILSGMYSDAVCGWDASVDRTGVDKMTAFEHVELLWKRASALELPDRIVDGISADLQAIRADWKNGSSITSFNEYMYVRERNAKFHLLMSDSWRAFAPVALPFTENRIAMTFYSLPTHLREHKQCTFLATCYLAPELDNLRNVSSLFWEVGLGSKRLDAEYWCVRKINRVLQYLLGSKVQFVERAITEIHGFNLKYHHAKMCEDAYAKMTDYGLCDKRTTARFQSRKNLAIPFFSHYQLVSNVHALMLYVK